ncbi:hypothetical protein MKW92_010270 [Papaver armeniacum]|nr:hypothetical protein MKW92_010270 [Papaver armeniacum]
MQKGMATVLRPYMELKNLRTGDVYSTNVPQAAFNSRISFCLNMHNEAVCALQFPPNSHKKGKGKCRK